MNKECATAFNDCVYYLFENILFCYESISLRWAKEKKEVRTSQFAVLNGVSLHPKGPVRLAHHVYLLWSAVDTLRYSITGSFDSFIVVCGYEMGQLRKTTATIFGLRVWKHTRKLCQEMFCLYSMYCEYGLWRYSIQLRGNLAEIG